MKKRNVKMNIKDNNNTVTLKELLNSGVSYSDYRKAKDRGQIIVLQIGNPAIGKDTIIDAESPYLKAKEIIRHQDK